MTFHSTEDYGLRLGDVGRVSAQKLKRIPTVQPCTNVS